VKQEHRESSSDIICYNCQGKGHVARHCRKPKKRLGKPGLVNERDESSNYSGREFQPSVSGSQPTVQSTVSCIEQANPAFVKLRVYISEEDELFFLIDTGADISLLKGNKLIGSTKCDPHKRVKVRCVDGSPMETHGVVKAKIDLSERPGVHNYQLVNMQVDIPCNGILGREFLQKAKARICYES
jgi:hypothetical protein